MFWSKRKTEPQPTDDVLTSTLSTTSESTTDDVEPETPPRKRLVAKFLRSQLGKPRRLIGLAVVLALGGVIVAAPHWLPDLNKRPEYQVKANLIKITPPPDYIPSDFLTKLLKEGGLPETLSLLDPDLVPDVVKAFQGNAWVQEVTHVRKSYPSELIVELLYRAPVAMIRVPDGRYPVDAEGVVLPPEDFDPEIAALYPEILNAPAEEQVELGKPWNNPAVCEAAQLLRQLETEVRKYNLVGVEVPRLDNEGNLGPFVLKTKGNTRIVWGSGPYHDLPGEVSTRMKIERLEDYARKWDGNLDSEGNASIDITPPNTIRVQRGAIANTPDDTRRRN